MCRQVNERANELLQHIYLDTTWREFDFNYDSLDKGTDINGVPWYKKNSSNVSLRRNRVDYYGDNRKDEGNYYTVPNTSLKDSLSPYSSDGLYTDTSNTSTGGSGTKP